VGIGTLKTALNHSFIHSTQLQPKGQSLSRISYNAGVANLSLLQASLPETTHLCTENKLAEKTSNTRQLEES